MSELLVSIVIALIMLVGLVGIFIPFFPDLLLIWGAALGYGLILNWRADGIIYFVLITGLMLIGIFADFGWAALEECLVARLGNPSCWDRSQDFWGCSCSHPSGDWHLCC